MKVKKNKHNIYSKYLIIRRELADIVSLLYKAAYLFFGMTQENSLIAPPTSHLSFPYPLLYDQWQCTNRLMTRITISAPIMRLLFSCQ